MEEVKAQIKTVTSLITKLFNDPKEKPTELVIKGEKQNEMPLQEQIKEAEKAFEILDEDYQKKLHLRTEWQSLLQDVLLLTAITKQHTKDIPTNKKELDNSIDTLNKLYTEDFRIKRKKLEDDFQVELSKIEKIKNERAKMEQNFNFGLENGEREKLEELSNKTISNIVFNSIKDDWS
ncbi:hypothetical protein EIN_214380 [Entamoeba invadens IP1]|uniref:Uncharacterized protein n=1 Tax=Entamoeba invadens IP1 TaxID=370355 RepID=L7FM32_ENTIV|nr:hypothetical protein EIN_214380 [Entamoeba invadens IP1]ELP87660.1 hypothetical protein EIN_214380 [Entamoeba invadens IP1]|eukprot:XP_004254431.1 hypothetical protein EIN_214380 [Entamoeba invadens IP1]